ncbi:MAG: hypothetical protein BVN33_16700 [Proteobacteria bacterium ST_bin13]|nr:MAG: hypothetical protein BVN33_16700 [Proteobacteria bacterium ST_bin13]
MCGEHGTPEPDIDREMAVFRIKNDRSWRTPRQSILLIAAGTINAFAAELLHQNFWDFAVLEFLACGLFALLLLSCCFAPFESRRFLLGPSLCVHVVAVCEGARFGESPDHIPETPRYSLSIDLVVEYGYSASRFKFSNRFTNLVIYT